MVSLREFIGQDGMTIRWRRLLTLVFSAGVLAYFEGVVQTLFALADVPIALLAGLGDFLGEYIALLNGFPAVIVRAGWRGAIPYVTGAGIAGYVVALTIVLVTMGVLALVIDRVR